MDPNQRTNQGMTALHIAAYNGNLCPILLLLSCTAFPPLDINQKDDKGNTPLHILAMFNKLESASFLLQRGAQLDIQNNEGKGKEGNDPLRPIQI